MSAAITMIAVIDGDDLLRVLKMCPSLADGSPALRVELRFGNEGDFASVSCDGNDPAALFAVLVEISKRRAEIANAKKVTP